MTTPSCTAVCQPGEAKALRRAPFILVSPQRVQAISNVMTARPRTCPETMPSTQARLRTIAAIDSRLIGPSAFGASQMHV